jgi:hypothetical protein
MKIFCFRGKTRLLQSTLMATALFSASTVQALIITTSDLSIVAAFQSGATIENFDDLTAFPITSYSAGQTITEAAKFNSRNGSTHPTFNSGGGSFNDPVGNPGHPVGIFAPSGSIAGDVRSGSNVAGPLVIFEDEPFNSGFMEVFFAGFASKVGFWVTEGTVTLQLRDFEGNPFTTGDFEVTATKGQFVGISRDSADVKIAAMVPTSEAFTIDDFTYLTAAQPPTSTVPDTSGAMTLVLAGGFLWFSSRKLGVAPQ